MGINVRALNKVNLKKSKFSQKSQRWVIGKKKKPYPIKISLKPISEALKPYECIQIKNKRVNLMKARRDYAKKFGKKLEGMCIINTCPAKYCGNICRLFAICIANFDGTIRGTIYMHTSDTRVTARCM